MSETPDTKWKTAPEWKKACDDVVARYQYISRHDLHGGGSEAKALLVLASICLAGVRILKGAVK